MTTGSYMTDDQAGFYDYAGREARFRDTVRTFVGCRLTAVRVHVLHGKINQVFLGLDERVVSVQGDVGGEVLKIVEANRLPELGIDEDSMIWQPPPAEPLIGCFISAARVVGETWNGHGMELALKGHSTKTILISSMENAENDTQVHDALRIAFPNYLMEII